MSRWKIRATGLVEREHDYTADFSLTNMDTNETVKVSLTQTMGSPAADLVGACRALAQLLIKAATDEDNSDTRTETIN